MPVAVPVVAGGHLQGKDPPDWEVAHRTVGPRILETLAGLEKEAVAGDAVAGDAEESALRDDVKVEDGRERHEFDTAIPAVANTDHQSLVNLVEGPVEDLDLVIVAGADDSCSQPQLYLWAAGVLRCCHLPSNQVFFVSIDRNRHL